MKITDLHPATIFFFICAVLAMLIGILNGFEYKALNIIIVSLNAIVGLLCQYVFGRN